MSGDPGASVAAAVEAELEAFEDPGALGAVARVMARDLDHPEHSLTSRTLAAKVLIDALEQLHAKQPPAQQEDRVDELKKQRDRRIARAAG